jgi:hypothetical protein
LAQENLEHRLGLIRGDAVDQHFRQRAVVFLEQRPDGFEEHRLVVNHVPILPFPPARWMQH